MAAQTQLPGRCERLCQRVHSTGEALCLLAALVLCACHLQPFYIRTAFNYFPREHPGSSAATQQTAHPHDRIYDGLHHAMHTSAICSDVLVPDIGCYLHTCQHDRAVTRRRSTSQSMTRSWLRLGRLCPPRRQWQLPAVGHPGLGETASRQAIMADVANAANCCSA